MFINEVIERADKLCENEYTKEEKYHWCDMVTAELRRAYNKEFKRVRLERWRDRTFLLPEDCEFEYIEKLIFMGREIKKEDLRNFGFIFEKSGSGQAQITVPPHIKFAGGGFCAPHLWNEIEVVYLPQTRPIRHIELSNVWVKFPEKDSTGKRCTLTMDNECPFIPGDNVDISSGDVKSTLHIIKRTSDFDEINIKIYFKLEYGEGEADEFTVGETRVDMKRIVTDTTLCAAPYDEMYLDYICAQICFYQRKTNMYEQFISRYNERFREYGNIMKSYAPDEDRSQFRNWWKL